MKEVLLLQAGEAAAPVRLSVGDYPRWFSEAVHRAEVPCRLRLVRPHLGEQLPSRPRDYQAMMMTGSPLSVTQLEEWMRRAADYLREAAEQGVPVLGVCFGHQLLGHAYGARVVKNPRGRELGTVEVELTSAGRADPLFRGVAPRFAVQATHEDILESLPEGAVALAENDSTPLQAMAIGPRVRGVQFHPELSSAGMRAVIRGKPTQAAEAGVRAAPAGPALLRNFIQGFT